MKFPDGSEYVECPICGRRTRQLQTTHIQTHGIKTMLEFRSLYPDHKTEVDSLLKEFSERISGSNNPGFQHGGKLSPFSNKSGRNKEQIQEAKMVAKANRIANHGCNSTLEFYTARGMNEEEAKAARHERQKTFTIDKCIEKYGKVEGFEIWKARQDKWQASLNSKSQEEQNEINARKSTKVNFTALWNHSLDFDAHFYIVNFKEGHFKIGITTRNDIRVRYRNKTVKEDLRMFVKLTIDHAFKIEQVIRRRFKDRIRKDNYGEYGWTEVLTNSTLEELVNEINPLIASSELTNRAFEEIYGKAV